MKENVKKFLEAASQDAELRKEIQNADGKEAVVKIAKAHGFELSVSDFENEKLNELSEDEMKAISGGTDFCTCTDKGAGTEGDIRCVCNQGGEGVNINNQHFRCGCFSTLGAGFGMG